MILKNFRKLFQSFARGRAVVLADELNLIFHLKELCDTNLLLGNFFEKLHPVQGCVHLYKTSDLASADEPKHLFTFSNKETSKSKKKEHKRVPSDHISFNFEDDILMKL